MRVAMQWEDLLTYYMYSTFCAMDIEHVQYRK